MANQVTQAQLITDMFAALFENQLVAAKIVSWRKYDRQLNPTNRLEVSEQIPPRYVVRRNTSVIANLSSGTQDSIWGSERVKVDQCFTTDCGWADFEYIRDIQGARENQALMSHASKLAHEIDGYILDVAAKASNNWIGTPGNNIDNLEDFMLAYVRAMEEGVPASDLCGVLTHADQVALQKYITELPAPDRLSSSALARLELPNLGNIPVMFTQQLPTLTVGSRAAAGSATVRGANQNVNYRDVANSAAQGQFNTQLLNINLPSGETIAAGEVFTIAGVFARDPRLGAPLGRLQQFTAVTGATGNSSNEATIRIAPAIVVPGTGSGGDQNVNTAHGMVTAAPANNAAITFLGAANTAYKLRMLIHKDSIMMATRELAAVDTGTSAERRLKSVPLTVRYWKGDDILTGQRTQRFDVFANANIMNRQSIVRVNG